MKKGFTLVEVLVTLAILTVLLLIAVPVYINVQSGINESVYQSKIKEVLSKAEAFASETNRIVFDVETLIEEGDILADNEIGEYIDPRTGRDMRCDIIQLFYRNNRYEAIITESNICYDSTELEDLYGMVELELYDINDKKLEKIEGTDWQKENTIKVKYRVKDEYKEYEDDIVSVVWSGEEAKSCEEENLSECESYVINVNEIKNVEISVSVSFLVDEVNFSSRTSKQVLVDLQKPYVLDGSVNVNNDISTNNERRVEFEIGDGSGSGVKSYSIVKTKSCNGNEYEENKQNASDGVQSVYLGNGDYYICVEDKVGNKTSDEDLDNPKNQIHVEGVDTSIPVIGSFTIKSRKNGYNDVDTILTISASDDGGTNGLQMCISNTGYLQGCSWEKYNASKNWKVTGSLDGKERTVYLSIRDSAGNVVSREAKYTVYKDCSNQKKEYTESNYGTCSKSCGGGIQYRAYRMKDSKTGTICTTGKDSKTCNTMDCCSKSVAYKWDNWSNCSASCGGGTRSRTVYYKSTYNGESCGTLKQSENCNTMNCCSSKYISGYGPWKNCSVSCGGGIQYRDVYYKSNYNNQSCGTVTNGDSRQCNTQSCDIYLFDGSNNLSSWDSVAQISGPTRDNYSVLSYANSSLEMHLPDYGDDQLGALLIFYKDPIDITQKNKLTIEYSFYVEQLRGGNLRVNLFSADTDPKDVRTANCDRGSNLLFGCNKLEGYEDYENLCCYYSRGTIAESYRVFSVSTGNHSDFSDDTWNGTVTIDLSEMSSLNGGKYYIGLYGSVYESETTGSYGTFSIKKVYLHS